MTADGASQLRKLELLFLQQPGNRLARQWIGLDLRSLPVMLDIEFDDFPGQDKLSNPGMSMSAHDEEAATGIVSRANLVQAVAAASIKR